MKKIIILFGGESAEHEVSVISGLQIIENIDKKLFAPYAIKHTKSGLFKYYSGLDKRQDYMKIRPQIVNFGKDEKGSYFQTSGILKKEKVYIDAAYLAFHGGKGESGQVQGFLETLGVAYTSPNVESSAISMNKVITKEVLASYGIPTCEGVSVWDEDIKKDVDKVIKSIKLKLPVIIKPVHLGSSIGVNVAKTGAELKKYLLAASHFDSEILVEKLVTNLKEYNISVRKIDGRIETSEVEKPVSQDEILSFADKYQRGGKKSGGMASLNRELPAKISSDFRDTLKKLATDVFKAVRAKGVIRIDFMTSGKAIYVTEVNPIPGSMSFYLWEASGISFKEQITDLIYQAVVDFEKQKAKNLDYKSDIVETFVAQKS